MNAIIDEIKSDLRASNLYHGVTVGPHLAKQLLEMNTRNRPVRQPLVDSYAHQMESGSWKFTGSTIKISRSGAILDCQHRLLAIEKSGRPQKFNIQTGLDDTVFDVIDTGRNRTSGDVLAIAGYRNGGYLGGAIKLVIGYYKRYLGKTKTLDKLKRPTNHDVLMWLKDNNEDLMLQCVRMGINYYASLKLFSPSTYAGLLYIFSIKNREQAIEFFDKLTSGEGMSSNHPVQILRQKMLKLAFERKTVSQDMKYALVIKSWNLFREKKETTRITWGDEEKFPRVR